MPVHTVLSYLAEAACVCSGFSTDILQEAAAGHKPLQLGMTSFLRVRFASRPRKAVVLERKKLLLSEG